MIGKLELTGGSWVGRDHRLTGRNNQDGWTILESDGCVIGIVADGCGSGSHSDVGSQIGVKILAEAIRDAYSKKRKLDLRWSRIQQHVLSQIDLLARSMGGNYREVVEDYFLFTLIGFVIDNDRAVFFSLGDGTIIINDELIALGPFPGNAPPYLGYCLIQDQISVNPLLLRMEILSYDVDYLENFVIATDGIDDFIASENRTLPGQDQLVGPLAQFYQEDRYFGNPELVSRRLKLIGRDWPVSNPHPGLLHDDTTLIIGRRHQETQEME